MSAPDFYYAVNATARHILEHYGKDVLVDYWRCLGREYYRNRIERWREGGAARIAEDWQAYFGLEPGSRVEAAVEGDTVELDILTCPAIKHLRDNGREIVDCYCEHCDHICGAMAEAAGYRFQRTGGMGACRQRFVPLTVDSGRGD